MTVHLPKDVQQFLENSAYYDWAPDASGVTLEVVASNVMEAQNLCDKYKIKYVKGFEDSEDGTQTRDVYSDGTKGEWY